MRGLIDGLCLNSGEPGFGLLGARLDLARVPLPKGTLFGLGGGVLLNFPPFSVCLFRCDLQYPSTNVTVKQSSLRLTQWGYSASYRTNGEHEAQ